MRHVAATFAASWGRGAEVEVQLDLTPRNWSRLLKGKGLSIRSKGYCYEGEFFWDYWNFSGGLDDWLEINWGTPKDRDYSAQGFIGIARETLVFPKSETGARPVATYGVDRAQPAQPDAPTMHGASDLMAYEEGDEDDEDISRRAARLAKIQPFAKVIESYISTWKLMHGSAGSGIYYRMGTGAKLRSLRSYIEKYVCIYGKMPASVHTVSVQHMSDFLIDFDEIRAAIST